SSGEPLRRDVRTAAGARRARAGSLHHGRRPVAREDAPSRGRGGETRRRRDRARRAVLRSARRRPGDPAGRPPRAGQRHDAATRAGDRGQAAHAGPPARAGATALPRVLETVATLRTQVGLPIALMTYYNPVFVFGLKGFARTA